MSVGSEVVLDAVVRSYLESADFNGVPVADLMVELGVEREDLQPVLQGLVAAGRVGILFPDDDDNPHVLRFGFTSREAQLGKLAETSDPVHTCVYPTTPELEGSLGDASYAERPYTHALALGRPQLEFCAFDPSVLETYRNDPRYSYQTNDIGGSISVHDENIESGEMLERDRVLLQTFGFAYDEQYHRAVAAFLRYLSDLSPEHQQTWRAKELSGGYRLHPDYFRNTVLGEWGERESVFVALLVELHVVNRMSIAMGRPPLFRREYGEHGEGRPQKFCFLIRPTADEFNAFVLLLDKLLSDNIDKAFFKGEVSDESEEQRADGKTAVRARGTLSMLDEWLRKNVRLNDWTPWDEASTALRRVRKLRQKPAHAVDDNAFDQQYFVQQRELMLSAYEAVRIIRQLLANHPAAKTVDVPDWLYEGLIWDI